MFEAPDSALDDLAMQYDLNEIDLYLIKAYLDLSKGERAEFSEAILNKLLTILKKELHTDQKNQYLNSMTKSEVFLAFLLLHLIK